MGHPCFFWLVEENNQLQLQQQQQRQLQLQLQLQQQRQLQRQLQRQGQGLERFRKRCPPERNRRSFDSGGKSATSAQDDNFYGGYFHIGTALADDGLLGGWGGGVWLLLHEEHVGGDA
jgi:hypothetical protein